MLSMSMDLFYETAPARQSKLNFFALAYSRLCSHRQRKFKHFSATNAQKREYSFFREYFIQNRKCVHFKIPSPCYTSYCLFILSVYIIFTLFMSLNLFWGIWA